MFKLILYSHPPHLLIFKTVQSNIKHDKTIINNNSKMHHLANCLGSSLPVAKSVLGFKHRLLQSIRSFKAL